MNENTRKTINETISAFKSIRNYSILNIVVCVIGLERFFKLDVYSFDYIKTFDFSPGSIVRYALFLSMLRSIGVVRFSMVKIRTLKESLPQRDDGSQ